MEYTLLESYLSSRKQFIQVNNIKSNTHETNIGVPQGSVISPLLFLIHINDLPNCTNMEVLNFADDTLLYIKIPPNSTNIENHINSELAKVNKWVKENHLKMPQKLTI